MGGVFRVVKRGARRFSGLLVADTNRCGVNAEVSGPEGLSAAVPRTNGRHRARSMRAGRRYDHGDCYMSAFRRNPLRTTTRVAIRAEGWLLAERVGFEPTESCNSALFKSAAFDRSATSPRVRIQRLRNRPGASRGSRPASVCRLRLCPGRRSSRRGMSRRRSSQSRRRARRRSPVRPLAQPVDA
jgi:hypothetical protein